MFACTRCGRKHTDPEEALGKRLSCTDVKRFWLEVRDNHRALHGHLAHIIIDESGNWICSKCERRLGVSHVKSSDEVSLGSNR